jgi:hypothetical protein
MEQPKPRRKSRSNLSKQPLSRSMDDYSASLISCCLIYHPSIYLSIYRGAQKR